MKIVELRSLAWHVICKENNFLHSTAVGVSLWRVINCMGVLLQTQTLKLSSIQETAIVYDE